ncbi:glycosyltransferase [Microbacter margulisiae]|uniref:Glycosyltransferase involved in cell wall biosynthesis n=1 Tax=Microbacter margulisiae TaxID=1350067 RepID=A0A7W5H0P9_9PORP|nr:glycosyltransferase [Microbacter margulisiae]MBB3186783.1 glycosyltransferase involved in cell wall biosynthesis [Microbacter margulisiae]
MMKAIVLVSNDLATDHRVERTCSALQKCDYDVLLVGRLRKNSLPMDSRSYPVRRMRLFFEKEALFYAELNIRFFFFLLFHKADLIYVNDLDTLLAGYLASRLKSKRLIYDSHEYFTEVPELQKNFLARNVWLAIERWILPKLRDTITVNQSIADMYNREYPIQMVVVRNVPMAKKIRSLSRVDLELPQDKFLIILQGAINMDRGGEELIAAMQEVNAFLLIIGEGDAMPQLKYMTNQLGLHDKIRFIPRQPGNILLSYTALADLGVSLDKNSNLNYYYSLPNKLFDYIQAGIPVLASNLPEIAKIVQHYHVGELFDSHDPHLLAASINDLIHNPERLQRYRENSRLAAKELCWEREESCLIDVIRRK